MPEGFAHLQHMRGTHLATHSTSSEPNHASCRAWATFWVNIIYILMYDTA